MEFKKEEKEILDYLISKGFKKSITLDQIIERYNVIGDNPINHLEDEIDSIVTAVCLKNEEFNIYVENL